MNCSAFVNPHIIIKAVTKYKTNNSLKLKSEKEGLAALSLYGRSGISSTSAAKFKELCLLMSSNIRPIKSLNGKLHELYSALSSSFGLPLLKVP